MGETVKSGWNVLTSANRESIIGAVKDFKVPKEHPQLYGDGNAAEKIVKILTEKG